MSTEAEVVLMSLTNEELGDAARWLEFVHGQWTEHVRRTEETGSGAERFGRGTDGPTHLIRALDMAIVREWAQRGGAPAWYVGMPLEGHPAAAYMRFYQERVSLNPDEGRKPRLTAAGILDKVCIGCREAKPLTVAFWAFLGTTLDDWCRTCRQAPSLIAEPVAAAAHAAVEPFSAADVESVELDAL